MRQNPLSYAPTSQVRRVRNAVVVLARVTYPELKGTQVSIRELAVIIAEALDFNGEIVFNSTQSDGQLKKVRFSCTRLNSSFTTSSRLQTASNQKLRRYLPNFIFTDLKNGIQETVAWFVAMYPEVRRGYQS